MPGICVLNLYYGYGVRSVCRTINHFSRRKCDIYAVRYVNIRVAATFRTKVVARLSENFLLEISADHQNSGTDGDSLPLPSPSPNTAFRYRNHVYPAII